MKKRIIQSRIAATLYSSNNHDIWLVSGIESYYFHKGFVKIYEYQPRHVRKVFCQKAHLSTLTLTFM